MNEVTDYSKRTDNKEVFTVNVFKKFTDECGGNASEFAEVLYQRFTVEDFAFHDDLYYFGVEGYFTSKVVPHKIAVWQAGVEIARNPKISEILKSDMFLFKKNLWFHDLSKFSANESFGYAMHDFKNPHPKSKEGFEKAWHHHKMNNPHHPEYWLNPNRSGELEPINMPDIYILEMISDWIGAGKTYGSSLEEWLPKNIGKFRFANPSRVSEIVEIATGIITSVEDGVLSI